jgi:hypothetical protein
VNRSLYDILSTYTRRRRYMSRRMMEEAIEQYKRYGKRVKG